MQKYQVGKNKTEATKKIGKLLEHIEMKSLFLRAIWNGISFC